MTKFCIREFDYLSISKYGTVESSQAVFNQWHAYKLKYISLFEIKWEKKKVGMIFTCNWTKRRTSLSDLKQRAGMLIIAAPVLNPCWQPNQT